MTKHVSGANVGHFMVAVGAIIRQKKTGKILVLKREDEFQKGTWEILYGRIDNHEELDVALRRETFEETGLTELEIVKLNHIWHIYRGEKNADKEIYGFTYVVETEQKEVKLSSEHSQYKWVKPEEAVEMVEVNGIKQDIEIYLKNNRQANLILTDIDRNQHKI